MAKAFLSHSSHDKGLVEKIALQLGKNNCHYDVFTFEAGAQTIEEIFRGLEDTDIFVLFISGFALKSDWVKKEILEAKRMLSRSIIERIFPIIIDKAVDHKNDLIPEWIKKPYNLKYLDNEVIILKKIRQLLRESNFKKYAHLRELNDLFVGRNEIIQNFERKIVNIENTKPTCIIASSYFDGIGRRTFLKNGLIKTRIIDKWYEPIPISINAKESIEDFLYKLNFVDTNADIFTHDFTIIDIDEKIKLAQKYIKKFVDDGEIILIIDDGSIVLPNHTLADWFTAVISEPEIQNQVSICVVSKFRPYAPIVKKLENVISFQVDELSYLDTQTLFIQYLNIYKQNLRSTDIQFFLPYLKGIPGQIIYAANLIESLGVVRAKEYVQDIEEFDELRAFSIFDFLHDDQLSKQMLIALSKFEIISYDLVYKIFGESDEVYKSIQKLFDLSLFYSVSSTHEYLKLNTSISDYINRSKIELDKIYNDKIREIVKESLQNEIHLDENSDYASFLFTLQSMIRENKPIPPKYLIPSFIIKSIVKEYYERNYETVIRLAKQILGRDNKFDRQIIWETENWLCLAYCREQDDKFFDEINYFKDNLRDNETLKDYYFLLGFYHRNGDRMEQAEEYYRKVLSLDENHSKTKRELVNVYLRNGEYMEALRWAQDNYIQQKTNIYHIQAFFTCLIKKPSLDDEDMKVIQELLDRAQESIGQKASDIYREMLAEFFFYVDHNSTKAVKALEELLRLNSKNYFAFRALLEMYRRQNDVNGIRALMHKYPDLVTFQLE